MIDHYVINLPFDARQEIFNALERVNVLAVEKCWKKKRISTLQKCWLFGRDRTSLLLYSLCKLRLIKTNETLVFMRFLQIAMQ